MSHTPLKNSIMDRIKKQQVTPISRWRFVLKNYALWIPGVVSVFVGAMATSAIIFSLTHAGWRYYQLTHGGFMAGFVATLPYLWIIAAVIFGYVAINRFRHTAFGYQYRTALVVLLSVLTSIVLGVLGFIIGVGKNLDETAGRRVPHYTSTKVYQQNVWAQPKEGRLAGQVMSNQSGVVVVRDFYGDHWQVSTDQIANTGTDENKFPTMVRIIGYQGDGPRQFVACIILPWRITKNVSIKNKAPYLPRLHQQFSESVQPIMVNQDCDLMQQKLKRR